MLNVELPVPPMRLRREPARRRSAVLRVRVLAGAPAACPSPVVDASAPAHALPAREIDPLVLRWMPVAVPMAAVLLCACIGAIWQFVM
jgi:hypothetical protein